VEPAVVQAAAAPVEAPIEPSKPVVVETPVAKTVVASPVLPKLTVPRFAQTGEAQVLDTGNLKPKTAEQIRKELAAMFEDSPTPENDAPF
jgi:hypothetical protein